jgi:tetratricopeptide (TPR) repeat protein
MELHSGNTDSTTSPNMASKNQAESTSSVVSQDSIDKLLDNAIKQGIQGHKNGYLELAEEVFSSILNMYPDHAQANHRMGLLKIDSGVTLKALPYLENAIISDPSIFQFWVSLSETLVQLGQFEEAIKIINLAKESGLDGEEFKTLETKLTTNQSNV